MVQNLELEKMNLTPLDQSEINNTDGGWASLIKAVLEWAIGYQAGKVADSVAAGAYNNIPGPNTTRPSGVDNTYVRHTYIN